MVKIYILNCHAILLWLNQHCCEEDTSQHQFCARKKLCCTALLKPDPAARKFSNTTCSLRPDCCGTVFKHPTQLHNCVFYSSTCNCTWTARDCSNDIILNDAWSSWPHNLSFRQIMWNFSILHLVRQDFEDWGLSRHAPLPDLAFLSTLNYGCIKQNRVYQTSVSSKQEAAEKLHWQLQLWQLESNSAYRHLCKQNFLQPSQIQACPQHSFALSISMSMLLLDMAHCHASWPTANHAWELE